MMTAPFIPPRNNAELLALLNTWMEKYSPDQQRDPHGRWTAGAGAQATAATQTAQQSRLKRAFTAAAAAWGSARPVLTEVGRVAGGIALAAALSVASHHLVVRPAERAYAGAYARAERARAGGPSDATAQRASQRQRYEQARAQAEREAAGAYDAFSQRFQQQQSYQQEHTRRQHSVYGRKDVESDAERKMRLDHGIKAARILTLYLRAGTEGEKQAAAAALHRMGIDVTRYSKAAKASIWSLLDPFITEAEARAILAALVRSPHIHTDQLHAAALRSRVQAMQMRSEGNVTLKRAAA
jgi:hypothetical protein